MKSPDHKSFFLFGPRGTEKTHWVRSNFKKALYLDLLESDLFVDLLADPGLLEELIPEQFNKWCKAFLKRRGYSNCAFRTGFENIA